jgi:catechol 2,3-dioxygenase-like lactoylglutathione lyase family enzyme
MRSALKIKRFIIFLLLLFLTSHSIVAQQVDRPAIWGIAKMTFLVSDFQVARDYYGKFLGFGEAFSYPSDLGKVISFKVNDRQFLEFVVDVKAKEKKRLVSVSFETENVEQMRQYLKSQKIAAPEKISIDGAGNEVIVVDDLSGNHIEFIDLKANGLHRKSKGQFLSDRRISKRIHHVGLYADTIRENDPFYLGVLKFTEIIRLPEDKTLSPFLVYYGMGDCIENIEHYSPNDENVSHPCFLVDDMQETIYSLKERKGTETLGKPGIGKGKRWIMNMYNFDKTRVEFTEAHTIK